MTMELAIETRGRAPVNAKRDRAQRPPQPLPRRTVTAATSAGRVDPAVKAVVSGPSASRAYRRTWGSRYGMADAIVTLGTIVGFMAALAVMTGEWLLAPTDAPTQTIVAKGAAAASPTVATGSTIEPRAAPRPL